ncbi:Hypothetical predicted protein [Olea europaea subsp. europaea]|uniref:DUF4378 domain-containing protein n=2 Tax=Olea europaea subsp. europaea TaxID=158383 RepID=A0A8S0UF83_OLEEU|nr:Hypothetical predicted protein [Olea europaea subsp. europaea]
MGMEKQGSKSGGYVGGFLQMFDWNAKSRKKLFSSKSDLQERSKQKKICDGNLPMTRLHMLDDDLMAPRSSFKGSSDYSCASSVTDEDFRGTKTPGVVGRLMGLDSLPKSNVPVSYSTPLFDTRSLPEMHYCPKNLKCFQDREIIHSSSLHELPGRNVLEPKYQKLISKPIEKFQTEILPPKSAKSIPITQNKLLSPIKSANFIPPKDAAHIMEAAARIIEPRHQTTAKAKTVRSSSVPLRVQDLKEKVRQPQKPSKRSKASEKPSESSAVHSKGQPRIKSWSDSVDSKSLKVSMDSEECSSGVKSTVKSISLALQAKANVQKREGINVGGSRSLVSQNEQNEFTSTPLFKSQPSTKKSVLKKPSTHNGSRVFQQNNQKQNCVHERGKSPSVKPFASNSQAGGKAISGDSSSARKKNSTKLTETSKVGSRRSSLEGKDDRTHLSCSSSERVTRKEQSTYVEYCYEKNQAAYNTTNDKNRKMIQSRSVDGPIICDKDNRRKGMDVISFTFTSPMTRTGPGPESSMEVGDKCERTLASSDSLNVSKFPSPEHNILRGDELSTLLERKLKELTSVVEFPQHRAEPPSSTSNSQDLVPCLNDSTASIMLHDGKTKDGSDKPNPVSLRDSSFSADPQGFKARNQCEGAEEEMDHCRSTVSEAKNLLDPWLPSPVSVLEQSSSAESWSSLDTVDSSSTTGSRQCSSVQAQEVRSTYSFKKFVPTEGDTELSDSASSISLPVTACGKSIEWELIYVKEVMCNIELMFKEYALGQALEIINPNLFDQLENQKGMLNGYDLLPRIDRRLLFDCASECLESNFRGYVGGGCKIWAKGVTVIRRKERLAQEVYREILGWSSMGDCMVDELVDKDMSSRYGRWLDFEIEAFELGIVIEDQVLNSLLDDVVADILVI